jgi:hypothetical protein
MLRVCLLIFATLLIACSGCGPTGPKLFPVSGTVLLDGQPLAEGTIYFKTLETGAIDTLPIKDGKFSGQAIEGDRRVEVVAYRLIPVAGQMGGEVQESLIASRFNSESTLKAVVSPTAANEYKFEVNGK